MSAAQRVPRVFIIEGLDRTGKSSLIEGIRDTCGYFEVIHYSKPQNLRIYDELVKGRADLPELNRSVKHESQFTYQQQSFHNMMELLVSGARLIFDRGHLGEFVYSPLYRNYSGDYVFDLERAYGLHARADIRLILLVEDLARAKHFIDDGNSLGPTEKRKEEQTMFVKAFFRSIIDDKKIICVTDDSSGNFRPKEQILKEALE